MNSKLIQEITRHLDTLCNAIGPRPTGSESNRAAVEYISQEFSTGGCSVELQKFDCIEWEAGTAELTVDGRKTAAAVSDYSLPCEIQAPYSCIGTLAELEKADLHGRIAVLYGELTAEPLMPKNFRFWNPETHRKIIGLLEEKNPAAILTVSFSETIPTPVIEDGDFNIPVAVIPKNGSEPLTQSSEGTAELKISSRRKPARAANVLARKGSGKRKIALSAHIDTKPSTPGALDNAGGVTTLLAVNSLLRESPPDRTIEFVVFNGEDYYSNAGEVTYLDRTLQTAHGYFLAINCDGLGLLDSRTALSFYDCVENLKTQIETPLQKYGGLVTAEPWYQGDHMVFTLSGIPALALTSEGAFSLIDSVIHTEKDTVELLDISSLEEAALFLSELLHIL